MPTAKKPAPKKPTAKPVLASKKTLMPKVTPKSPGKRQQIPPDYDVIIPGMGYTKPGKTTPPKKIKSKTSPGVPTKTPPNSGKKPPAPSQPVRPGFTRSEKNPKYGKKPK